MDLFITDEILNLLIIATTFSIFLMALIQKIKTLSFITTNGHIFILNFILAFSIGILFASNFFNLDMIGSLWVAFFSFIEAPAVYHILKKQNIINYTPKSLNNNEEKILKIPAENEIPRQ